MNLPKVSVIFNRRKTATRQREGSVEITVSFKGQRRVLATGIMLCLGQWNAASMRVKARPDATLLNRKLTQILSTVNNALDKMIYEGIVNLSCLAIEPKNEVKTFVEYVEKRIPLRIVGSTSRKDTTLSSTPLGHGAA